MFAPELAPRPTALPPDVELLGPELDVEPTAPCLFGRVPFSPMPPRADGSEGREPALPDWDEWSLSLRTPAPDACAADEPELDIQKPTAKSAAAATWKRGGAGLKLMQGFPLVRLHQRTERSAPFSPAVPADEASRSEDPRMALARRASGAPVPLRLFQPACQLAVRIASRSHDSPSVVIPPN